MYTTKPHGAAVQSPPIQEFKKKYSCLGRACTFGCCGGIIFVIVTLLFFYWIFNPKAQSVNTLPEHIAKDIPLYEAKIIDHISYVSFKKRQTARTYIEKNHPNIFTLIKKNHHTNIPAKELYEISWTALPAKPSFIFAYYKQQFVDQGFAITTKKIHNGAEIIFSNNTYNGTLSIIDRAAHSGTDVVTLTLTLP